jgi:hypothetical protein
LQKNDRSAPAGDDAFAVGCHTDETAPVVRLRDQRRKARAWAEAIAQPIGRSRLHGMQAAFALGQEALEAHQRRHVRRPRRAHAKRQLRHAVILILLPG